MATVELTAASRELLLVKQFKNRLVSTQCFLVKAMWICELFDEGFAVSYHATFSRITELSLKEWL